MFERFPRLKVVIVEGGFGWVPALTWRLDKLFERMRGEVPHLKRPPSEYMREHIWFTTQPMEEPDDARHLLDVIEWIGFDRLLFASDYPHWDFDDPRFAFKTPLTDAERAKIFNANARARLQARAEAMARHVVATDGRHPRRRQQGRHRRWPRDRRVSRQRRVLRAPQSLPARGRAAGQGGLRRAPKSDEPGEYQRSRVGEMLRCAWHGWEFDMRTGQSYFDPQRATCGPIRSRSKPARRWSRPYVAETFPVTIEESYVLIEI